VLANAIHTPLASSFETAALRPPQDEDKDPSTPHGEERIFPAALALSGARLRTMLRIAGRTMRPRKKRQ
jgi:hypothetical protein